jgi:hypothetical protein
VAETVIEAVRSGRGKYEIETGHDRGSSLTTRLSFGHSGIRVGLAGAFVERITASFFLGRLSNVLLRARTAAPVAFEADATFAQRSACGGRVIHVVHGGDGN